MGMAGHRQGGGGRFEGFQKQVRVAAARFRNWGQHEGAVPEQPGAPFTWRLVGRGSDRGKTKCGGV